MAVIETWLHQDLQEPVKVNHLDGNLFSNNGNGNRIGVVLTNNGEALASISGTVSGYVVTADGSTVPCTGSKSGNRASILIPAAAYQPGSIFITVFVTDGTTVTTVAAVSSTVMRSRTNAQVDPGSVVTDWTQTINAAMQSVETAAANLGGIVAVPYASITFPVPLGKYTYYNNNLYRCVTPIASSESFTAAHWTQVRLGDDVSDLKSALNSEMDGVFFDVANDKYASGTFHNVSYNLTGNTVKLNGTANGGFRLKISGANVDVASAVPDSWKSESIGLITGHKYILCVEYVSGTGSKSTVVMYDSSGSAVTSVDVDPSLATARNLMFADPFTATNSNAAYLVIYTTTSRIHNNLIYRFNFIDVTIAHDLIQNKIGLQTAEENAVISLMKNRYAASGMVDFGNENGSVTYSALTVTAKGSRFVIDGTTSDAARVKITNGLDAQHSTPSSWYSESLPVPDTSHEYIIAVSKLSGSVSTNKNCRIGIYNKDGSSGSEVAYFITEGDGFATGVAYSDVIKNAGDIACLIMYFPGSSSLNNVVLQIDLIDITVLKTLDNYILDKNCGLHDYYFDGNYITGRIQDIISLRAGASIHNASFLWFTDPHYYRPSASEQENGMQSAQIARYLKRELNNRYVICGGDLLRGTLTKAVCREHLIKAREYMDDIYDDLYMCLGNHEYNNPGDTSAQSVNELASPELYEMLCKHQGMVMVSVSTKADYSYIDKAQKIQYFILGCDNAADLFPESITWLANELLTVENGYHVVIISHIGLTTGSDDQNSINSKFYDVRDIIDAANSRGTFTYSGTTYDYSSINFEIVCALTGHVHYDGSATTPGGTPIIATTCDRAFVGSDGDAGIREIRKIGTIGEQALDYVLIDFDNHTIDLIRIGGSILGASYDSGTGKIYDTTAGTTTEYTGAEWVAYSPYKDRHFTYTGHLT